MCLCVFVCTLDRSYLTEVIRPCYLVLAEQYEDRREGAKPYLVKNYDDFNETFWSRSCLSLDVVGLSQDALRRKYTKTYIERQSWLLPMVSRCIFDLLAIGEATDAVARLLRFGFWYVNIFSSCSVAERRQ